MSVTLPRDWAGFRWRSAYAKLPPIMFKRQRPTPVRSSQLVALNEPLARELGLDAGALASSDGVALLAGNVAIEGVESLAQAYAGHQFGHFTILGDGRAALLGEHCTPSGRIVDIQWKGSGQTPYSRGGDGRLALGPALREFLLSEAMAALGIPTTRSLAIVATGEIVAREEMLPGAVLTRVASSHVRVGTFEFASFSQDEDALKALVDFCVTRHYPELGTTDSPERTTRFLERVIERQAELVAKWLSVGFIHGVMNTDNTAISGETIDYGPCAFLDTYDPGQVFSSIDRRGRYAFGQQPGIAGWNLSRFAETLIPLLAGKPEEGVAVANGLLAKYGEKFDVAFSRAFGAKLGFAQTKSDDQAIIVDLLAIAGRDKLDFHRLWIDLADRRSIAPEWDARWIARLKEEGASVDDAVARMRRVNPIVVPRNHRVEEALALAHDGDLSAFEKLLGAVRASFVDSPEMRELGAPPAIADPNYQTFCGT